MNYNDLLYECYEYHAFYSSYKKKIQHNDEYEHNDVIFYFVYETKII